MGVKVTGIDELSFLIRQIGDRAQRGVADQMKKEAIAIRDLARKMAPVDKHNLEKAIKVRESGGGRDVKGRFARKTFDVFVDEMARGTRTRSGTVSEYAYIMHEYLTPYGDLKLGKNSLAKQLGQPERVGGKFLERAVDEVSKDIMNRLIQVARSYF